MDNWRGFDNGWKFRLSFLTNLELRRLKELIDADLKEREEFF